jgi:hypothetical protein
VPRYVFEVNVAGTVRVRAADEIEARKVVPAVLLLPGPDDVRMANDRNSQIGWNATITSVNFRVKGDPFASPLRVIEFSLLPASKYFFERRSAREEGTRDFFS